MRNIVKIFVALCAVVALVGCCSACRQRYKNSKPLQGTEWHLVQLEAKDLSLSADSFNLVLGEDGSVAGIGACNRLLGQYTVTPNYAISLGQVGSTMMLCPDNSELESRFIQVLGVVTHYDIDGNKLMLIGDGAIKAIFEALPKRVE